MILPVVGQPTTRRAAVSIMSTRRSTSNTPSLSKSQYVHPLSQIVLEHLQASYGHHGENGLMSNPQLEFATNGTFVLTLSGDGKERIRIWTHYDAEGRKHYLHVKKGNLTGEYLLQDNQKPAWQDDAGSLHDKIARAVDDMMAKIQES